MIENLRKLTKLGIERKHTKWNSMRSGKNDRVTPRYPKLNNNNNK